MVNVPVLAVAIAIPVAGGVLGALATADQINLWYKQLRKPSWTPPNWLFGPMWTVLYVLMGVASYLVWEQGGVSAQALPLTVYAVQLALNFLWTPLFFKLHKLDWATYEIIALWCAIVATIAVFWPVIGARTALLLPYLAWVSLASALTMWIWRNNPQQVLRPERTPLVPDMN